MDGRLTSNCSAFRIAAEGVVPTEVVLTKATSEETTAHFEYILERNIGYPYIFPIDPQVCMLYLLICSHFSQCLDQKRK